MPLQITMPRLSDTMEEGTLVKWRVKVGDKVKSGDVLADIETDKATMELQNFDDGTVALLAVEQGKMTKVGGLILVLAKPGESVEEAAKATTPGTTAPAAAAKSEGSTAAPAAAATATATLEAEPAESAGPVRVSPLARKMAEEMGVDPSKLTGSGPDGRVIKRDILAAKDGKSAAAAAPAAPAPAAPRTPPAPSFHTSAPLEAKLITLTGMRKTIAKRLVESKSTIPHFTVTITVNCDPLNSLRHTLNDQLKNQGVKLSVNDFIVRGAALAIMQHPLVNSSWSDEGIRQHGSVNIGIAVALPAERGGGLVVPVIRDVQSQGLRSISSQTKSLAEKAKTTGLSPAEMDGGTFTISNLGMLGVDHFEAIINPPQAAILAVGAALKKPVVRNDQIVVGSEMALTLSADHRIVDGAMAAEYLNTLKQLLENPAALLV